MFPTEGYVKRQRYLCGGCGQQWELRIDANEKTRDNLYRTMKRHVEDKHPGLLENYKGFFVNGQFEQYRKAWTKFILILPIYENRPMLKQRLS